MNAPFRNPFIRTALLAGAMGTAYLLGRAHWGEMVAAASAKLNLAKEAQARLARQPLSLASMKNLAQGGRDLLARNSLKLGNSTLSISPGGQFYIDGENMAMLAKLDPQAGLALLAKLPHGKMTSEAYMNFFRDWVNAHPESADAIAAAANALSQSPEKTNALSGLAVAWAKEDPEEALNWAAGLDSANIGALASAMAVVSATQPALAAKYIQSIPDAVDRDQLIWQIATSWGDANWNKLDRTDTGATLDWLDQVATGSVYDQTVNNLFWTYGYIDPADGVTYLDKIKDPQDRKIAITQMSMDWAVTKPGAVLNWLQTLPDSDAAIRDSTIVNTFVNWSNKNSDAATAYVEGITDPQLFTTLAPALAPAIAKADPQAALNWVNGFPDSSAKTQAVSGVLATMAATNADAAWNYAADLPAGPGRDGAMDSIVSTVSVSDPAQAAALLGQIDSGPAQLTATNALAANWAQKDPVGLTTWIGTQPAGDVRDAAIAQYVNVQSAKNPATAVALANSMADPTARATQLEIAVLQLAKTNLAAATQAAQSANLTDTQHQYLLIQLSQASGK